MRRASQIHLDSPNDHERLLELYKPLSEEHYPRFTQLCERVTKNFLRWRNTLLKMKSFAHLEEVSEKEISILEKVIEESSVNGLEQHIGRMNRLLARFRLSIDYFKVE